MVALLAILALIILMVGWHIIFPLLGGVLMITAGVWLMLMIAMGIFAISFILLFVMAPIGILFLGLPLLVLALVFIILVPVLFPIIIPLVIIFWVISYFRHRELKHKKSSHS